MSKENVEVVRRAYEAWNLGDLETAFEFLDVDVEVSVPPDLPEAGTYRGRAEIRRWVAEQLLPILEEARAEPEEFLDAGDQVVVLVRYFGRGKASGIEVRGAVVDSHVWTLRDGKVQKLQMYQGTEKALEAAGLSEQDVHADA
jgi:ketosteroid isomerase-like protein